VSGEGWRDSAACLGSKQDFHPASAGGRANREIREAVRAALRVCHSCPVRAECLRWAVEAKEYYGIWGGTTEKERRVIIDRGIPLSEVFDDPAPTTIGVP
jgi:WhiB family redox-sensing transcriptional regulator